MDYRDLQKKNRETMQKYYDIESRYMTEDGMLLFPTKEDYEEYKKAMKAIHEEMKENLSAFKSND